MKGSLKVDGLTSLNGQFWALKRERKCRPPPGFCLIKFQPFNRWLPLHHSSASDQATHQLRTMQHVAFRRQPWLESCVTAQMWKQTGRRMRFKNVKILRGGVQQQQKQQQQQQHVAQERWKRDAAVTLLFKIGHCCKISLCTPFWLMLHQWCLEDSIYGYGCSFPSYSKKLKGLSVYQNSLKEILGYICKDI